MKKVLIISYYWPPSGGIGVLRYLKFVKYLQNYGWQPIVYAPENAEYESYDENNFKDVPENVIILRRKIFEPFSLFKKISGRKKSDSANPVYVRNKKISIIDKFAIWIRGNFFIPDARMLWIKPSVKFLKKFLKENPVDVIFSGGPPHTNTLIACKLSQETDIPCLIDFRDPWTQVDYYKMLKIGKRADKKHKKLEKFCFNIAKKITIVSPTWKNDLENIGAKNVDVIFNGYDEDDFKQETVSLDNKFSILHAGLLGADRMPETFLKVLSDLKKEEAEFSEDLQINFVGRVDYSINQRIKNLGLENNYNEIGNIPRPKVLELTFKTQLLLLPLNIAENAKGRIPGKLFENLRSKRPILCLGPTDSDVANILTETASGKTFEYNDYKQIKNYIIERYKLFKENKNFIQSNDIQQFTSKFLTKKLADFLDKL